MVTFKSTKIVRTCIQCGESFTVFPSNATGGRGKFCSVTCFTAGKVVPLAGRFARHLGPATVTGCIPWIGDHTRHGYGVITERRGGAVRRFMAHRVAWELDRGPIPLGLHVLHHCDNPPCVNVEHLFLGTPADNAADKVAKGRQCRGERCPLARTTEAVVRAVRARHAQGGISLAQLARDFGIGASSVLRIVNRLDWKHVE